MNNTKHITVMLKDAVDALLVKEGHWYVDGTFGRGGHSQEILNRGGKVIAFDFDHEAVEYGKEAFADSNQAGDFILVRENFSEISTVINDLKQSGQIEDISGVLFDFGTSTEQLTSQERGFSFEGDGPLDMRMDDRLGVEAKDLLALIPENQLTNLFREVGGEEQAKKIAREIKNSETPITTIKQLSKLIVRVKKGHRGNIHPATKVFQALRIAVNTEIENIKVALPQALEILNSDGRIVTIAFHSGEDREVKITFKSWQAENIGEMATKKPISPTEEEVLINPRSRSAKMRIFTKK